MKGPETNISCKCSFQVLCLSFWWKISEQNSEPIKDSLETFKHYNSFVFQSRSCMKSDNRNVKLKELF